MVVTIVTMDIMLEQSQAQVIILQVNSWSINSIVELPVTSELITVLKVSIMAINEATVQPIIQEEQSIWLKQEQKVVGLTLEVNKQVLEGNAIIRLQQD